MCVCWFADVLFLTSDGSSLYSLAPYWHQLASIVLKCSFEGFTLLLRFLFFFSSHFGDKYCTF